MSPFKTIAAGAVGGTLVGRLLGIGPIGTALGTVAGVVVGVLVSELGASRPAGPGSR